jgi:hypothetical protein
MEVFNMKNPSTIDEPIIPDKEYEAGFYVWIQQNKED